MDLLQPLAHVEAYLLLDGKKYELEKFNTKFDQPVDYKGQPQHEIKGGSIALTLTQAADQNLYMWAKKSTMTKDGVILFQTDLGMTVLEIAFQKAYCITLTRDINVLTGTTTGLVISTKVININGIEHDNFRKG